MVEVIITGVGSFLGGGLVTHFFRNKNYKAEAEATITGEALKLIQALQAEVNSIKNEVSTLRQDNIALHKQVALLEGEKIEMQSRVKHLESELARYTKVV